MANSILNIIHDNFSNDKYILIKDISIHNILLTETPFLEVCVPGFEDIIISFPRNSELILNSFKLGITSQTDLQQLPDGLYTFKYFLSTAVNSQGVHTISQEITKKIFRVNKLQEKFEKAFLMLDIGECDNAIKQQSMVILTTINFYIQAVISSSNNTADGTAIYLYKKANNMLDKLLSNNCGCN